MAKRVKLRSVGGILAVGLAVALLALLVAGPARAAGDESPRLQCGNGVCEGTERADTCPQDCLAVSTCGDGVCAAAAGETTQNCSADCFPWSALVCLNKCGNGSCEPSCGEDVNSCAADCLVGRTVTLDFCGDGTCNAGSGEDCQSCQADCGACGQPQPPGADGSLCGDGVCQAGESPDWCGDCAQGQPQSAPRSQGQSQGQGQSQSQPGATPSPSPTPTSTPTSTPTPTDAPTQTPVVITATPETQATSGGPGFPACGGSLAVLAGVVGGLWGTRALRGWVPAFLRLLGR